MSANPPIGAVSTAPFCFRKGAGYAVIFRYGAVVLIGLSPAEEQEVLTQYSGGATAPIEEERVEIMLRPQKDEGMAANTVLQIKALTPANVWSPPRRRPSPTW